MYYHVRIDRLDPIRNVTQTLYRFDIPDSAALNDEVVIPYLQEKDLLFSGAKIKSGTIEQLRIYQSENDIDTCVKIGDRLLGPNSFLAYTPATILGRKDTVPEITDDYLLPIRKQLQELLVQQSNAPEKTKQKKLFISHAGDDKAYVETIVGLFEFLGFDSSNMVCSNVDGYRIPLGADIYEYLRSLYTDSELFVIFVHSAAYYRSAACLNEMGAAWVLRKEYCSILLPDIDFGDLKGAVKPDKIAIKPGNDDAKGRLNELRTRLTDFFGLPAKDQTAWERHRDRLILNLTQPQNTPEK